MLQPPSGGLAPSKGWRCGSRATTGCLASRDEAQQQKASKHGNVSN